MLCKYKNCVIFILCLHGISEMFIYTHIKLKNKKAVLYARLIV